VRDTRNVPYNSSNWRVVHNSRNGGVRKRGGKPAVFWTAWEGVRRKNCNKTVVNRAAGNGLIFASVVV